MATIKSFSSKFKTIGSHNPSTVILCFFLCLLFSQTTVFSEPIDSAFHWQFRNFNLYSNFPGESLDDDYHHVPFPGSNWMYHYNCGSFNFPYLDADHDDIIDIYDALYSNGYIMAIALDNSTGPVHGFDEYDGYTVNYDFDDLTSAGKYTLDIVLGYVQRLDYVFGTFETNDINDDNDRTHEQNMQDIVSMVSKVRNSTNPNICNAFIANYGYMPGSTNMAGLRNIPNTIYWEVYTDRQDAHNDYMNSGLDCAMPDCYPYAFFAAHADPETDNINGFCSPNERSALFWTPLERFSTAKRALPLEHRIIPWINPFVSYRPDTYPTKPTRSDCHALPQHLRLRGADGYYSLGSASGLLFTMNAEAYDDIIDYIRDMADAWRDLEYLFADNDVNIIMNTDTDKEAGLEWSGIRSGNHILVLASNLGDDDAQISYPGNVGLPATSETIAAGDHVFFSYIANDCYIVSDDFNNGLGNWEICSGAGATWKETDGIKKTGGLELGPYYISARGKKMYVIPNEQLQISYYAKGEAAGAQNIVRYRYYDANGTELGVTVVGNGYPGTSYGEIQHNFTIPNNSDIAYIRPELGNYNLSYKVWIDDIIVEKSYNPDQVEDPVLIHLSFNGNPTFTKDEKGNIADGTAYGDAGVGSLGASGSCLGLGGTSGHVNFGDPDILNLTGSRTISAWIKPSAFDEFNTIAFKGYKLYLHNGKLSAYVQGSPGNNYSYSTMFTNTVATGVWQHVAMTFDNSDKKIRLYINGQEADDYYQTSYYQVTMTGSPISVDGTDFTVGSAGAASYFDGYIDEIKVFNRLLSDQEIRDEYLTLLSVGFETPGNTVKDSSYANYGTVIGARLTEGIYGKAMSFDGVDDYVDFGSPSILNLTGISTISAWIKPDAVDRTQVIVARNIWGHSLYINSSGKLCGCVAGTSTTASSASVEDITPGVWQHVAMVINTENGDDKIHLYINGLQVSYSTQTALTGSQVNVSGNHFSVGCDEVHEDYYFGGLIDELKVYKRTLSSAEMLEESGNILFVNFNEASGSVAGDSSANENDGTINGATWGVGISSHALSFDGVDDYVDFGTPASGLNLTGNSTISAWIKPDDIDGYQIIVSRYIWGHSLYINPDGKLCGYVAGSGSYASSVSSGSVSTNVWQHVAMTFNSDTGDSKVHLYINGVEVADYSAQTTLSGSPVNVSSHKFSVGCDAVAEDHYFDGMIDELKVFNRALTTTEIDQLYEFQE